MKAGQKVLIKDGSWMLTIENGKLVHKKESGKYPRWFRNEFVIVEIGCVYPFDHPFKYADTIIQNLENSDIWFCNSAMNLCAIKPIEYTLAEIKKIAKEALGHDFKIVKKNLS